MICISEILKNIRSYIVKGRYIREKGKGTPGQPGYKPVLWYWLTPDGKKLLVDQKSEMV